MWLVVFYSSCVHVFYCCLQSCTRYVQAGPRTESNRRVTQTQHPSRTVSGMMRQCAISKPLTNTCIILLFFFCIDICTKCSYNALIRNGTVIHFVLCGVIFIFWINLVKKKKIYRNSIQIVCSDNFLVHVKNDVKRYSPQESNYKKIASLHALLHFCVHVPII